MSEGAAGFDLWATTMAPATQTEDGRWLWTYGTGLAFEIPSGVVGVLTPRSSITKTGAQLGNSVGVIDSDFRGEVLLKFYTNVQSPPYMPGNRVGQILFLPAFNVEFVATKELTTTQRGAGGFGST